MKKGTKSIISVLIVVQMVLFGTLVLAEENDTAQLLLGETVQQNGLSTADKGVTVLRCGEYGQKISRNGGSMYLYIRVDDDFLYDIPKFTPLELSIEYFDEGTGSFEIDYDSWNPYFEEYKPAFPGGKDNQIWGTAGYINMEGSNTWKTHTIYFEDMRLANRLDGGADIRIGLWGPLMSFSKSDVIFKSVTLKKVDYKEPIFYNGSGSEKIGNIFNETDRPKIWMNYQNKSQTPLKYTIDFNVKDSNGTVVWTDTSNGEFGPAESKKIEIEPNITNEYAIYDVEANMTAWFENDVDKKYTMVSHTQLSRAAENDKQNPHFGAVQQVAGMERGGLDETIAVMKRMGLSIVRDECKWRDIEKEKGIIKIPDEDMEVYKKFHDNGIDVLCLLAFENALYDNGATPHTDEGIAGYANYCAYVAKELKGIVKYFEIWNEYNITVFNTTDEPPETYAKMLKAAYTAIKNVNPEAIVIGLDTAEIPMDWIERAMNCDIYDYMDAYSFHPYDWSGSFRWDRYVDIVTDLKELLIKYGPLKPIYYTEVGFSSYDEGYKEDLQASNSVMLELYNIAYDLCDFTTQYCLYNKLDPTEQEDNWGHNLSWVHPEIPYGAKQGHLAVCAYNKLAGTHKYINHIEYEGNYHAFRFENEDLGKGVVALRSENGEKAVCMNLGCETVELYDMFGNKTADLYSENGIFTFRIDEMIKYVVGSLSEFRFENECTPMIEADSSITECTRNDISCITFTKNTVKNLKIEVSELDDVKVYENNGFNGNTARLVMKTAPDAEGEYNFRVTITDDSGRVYYSEKHKLAITELITADITQEQAVKGSDTHWRVRVTVNNRSSSGVISGKLTVTEPEEENSAMPQKDIVDLQPGKSVTFLLNLPERVVKKTINFQIRVDLTDGNSYSFGKLLDFGSAAYAYEKPQIDGVIGNTEWSGSWIGADEAKDVKEIVGWAGPSDLSFSSTCMWDEDYLYLMTAVTDDIYAPDPITAENPHYLYRGDSVQIGIDNRETVNIAETSTYTEIGLGMIVGTGGAVWRYKSLCDLPTACNIDGSKLVIKNYNGYTVYECKIPWSGIINDKYTPKENDKFRFSMIVNDNDGGGRRGWIEYTSGIATVPKTVELFGSLILNK